MTKATRSDIPRASPPPSPRLFAGRNVEWRERAQTQISHTCPSQQVLNGMIKSAAILGTPLRFVTQQSRKLPLGSGFALATGFLLGEE